MTNGCPCHKKKMFLENLSREIGFGGLKFRNESKKAFGNYFVISKQKKDNDVNRKDKYKSLCFL